MYPEFKKLKLLLFSCFMYVCSHAQNINWLLGKWDGTGTNANNAEFIRTIVIDSVSGENFSGTRTNELKGRNRAKIVTAFTGYMDKGLLYIKNVNVLYKKEPPNGEWMDCSGCLPETKIAIQDEKIILTSRITGCQNECNSVTFFYKFLCDFDTSTQRYLVNRFGSHEDINAFEACIKKTPEEIAAENKRKTQIEDSIKNTMIIAQQKEQQRISDSITSAKVVAKKRQKEIDDSLAYIKQRQQQIDDSLKVVAANEQKRRQQVQDSIATANKIVQQKEQQRISDSITSAKAVAKKRQKEIDDSLAYVKQRQQQIDDSLKVVATNEQKRRQQVQDSIAAANKIAQQKEQQRISDSITNAKAIAKKRQKEMDDSLAYVKRRQQQLDDSLKVVAANEQKRRQQVQDSITTANKIVQQKEQQRISDSITNAKAIAKKRQKEMDDSLAYVKRRQQQLDDSLKVVAANEQKRRQQVQDSIAAANKIAQQKEQQRVADSIKNAAALVADDPAKVSTAKALETRDNLLLETYHITTPDILIELFDNAQIDGDRVSVYHNNALIVSDKMLVKEPITIKVHADPANRKHEFVMIAENLGKIAPNTALMRITAGNQVYKLSVKTDMKTNAKIDFYYDGN